MAVFPHSYQDHSPEGQDYFWLLRILLPMRETHTLVFLTSLYIKTTYIYSKIKENNFLDSEERNLKKIKFFSHLDCFLVFGDETFSMEPI